MHHLIFCHEHSIVTKIFELNQQRRSENYDSLIFSRSIICKLKYINQEILSGLLEQLRERISKWKTSFSFCQSYAGKLMDVRDATVKFIRFMSQIIRVFIIFKIIFANVHYCRALFPSLLNILYEKCTRNVYMCIKLFQQTCINLKQK